MSIRDRELYTYRGMGNPYTTSKKRQRTPPSADRRDRPELPWTDLVCVGKGTYGEVYRARPDDARRRTQGTTVALKKFIQRDDDWGFPITTLREHKILLQLRHANLIRLHEGFSPDSKYRSPVFMVFEYAELDLEIVIQSPVVRTIDEPRQKSIVQQILEGVHYMHANQVMHRELKPSDRGVPSCGGAFTPSTRVVSRNDGSGWALF